MEHEAEPGPTEAVGQDPEGTGGGTGSETAPAEAGGVTESAAVPERAVEGGAASDRAAAATPSELTTGEPRVDAALKLLDRLSELPVSDHPELFEQVHARLSEVLGELESGPDSTGPAGG